MHKFFAYIKTQEGKRCGQEKPNGLRGSVWEDTISKIPCLNLDVLGMDNKYRDLSLQHLVPKTKSVPKDAPSIWLFIVIG